MPYAGMAELADALDLGSSGQPCGFDSHYPYHVGAKFALLRRSFLPSLEKNAIRPLPCSSSPNCTRCAGLRFDSAASRYVFVHRNIDFSRPSQKKDMTKKSCLSFWISNAQSGKTLPP